MPAQALHIHGQLVKVVLDGPVEFADGLAAQTVALGDGVVAAEEVDARQQFVGEAVGDGKVGGQFAGEHQPPADVSEQGVALSFAHHLVRDGLQECVFQGIKAEQLFLETQIFGMVRLALANDGGKLVEALQRLVVELGVG